MPEYIRYVSVYTGPDLFPKLRDEYIEAWDRMAEGKNVKVIRKEELQLENGELRQLQLHSHLLFRVPVNSQDAPQSEIIDYAANIIASCLHPKIRDGGDSSEIGHHPLFGVDGRVVKGLRPCEWSPTEVDRQFMAYPRCCAEDPESKRVRRQRLKDFGNACVTYRRDSLGNTTSEVVDGSSCYINSDPNTRYGGQYNLEGGTFTF